MGSMDRANPGEPPSATTPKEADRRQARRAVALRANLRRRKEQERGRADAEPSTDTPKPAR